MSDRYKVVSRSQTGHCCYEATVVDTTKLFMVGGEHSEDEFEPICECLEEDDAKKIAAAMNAMALALIE